MLLKQIVNQIFCLFIPQSAPRRSAVGLQWCLIHKVELVNIKIVSPLTNVKPNIKLWFLRAWTLHTAASDDLPTLPRWYLGGEVGFKNKFIKMKPDMIKSRNDPLLLSDRCFILELGWTANQCRELFLLSTFWAEIKGYRGHPPHTHTSANSHPAPPFFFPVPGCWGGGPGAPDHSVTAWGKAPDAQLTLLIWN